MDSKEITNELQKQLTGMTALASFPAPLKTAQIGGLTANGVGQGCRTGYPLEILHKCVEKNILRSES